MKTMVFLLVALLLVTACATTQPAPTSTPLPPTEPPPTPLPEPTNLPPPEPTETPLSPPLFEVFFDGTDCTVEGPTELPPGDYAFTFIDESEWKGELWLINLDEDKTFQDNLDLQSEPGEWYAKPSWAHYDVQVSSQYDLPEDEASEGRRVHTSAWRLNKVAEHTIFCYVPSPVKLWFAAPIWIVETPTD